MASSLVYGVGINDADYVVTKEVNGRRVACPFYDRWKHMLNRCYCTKSQARQPTYKGCTVTKEWHSFMAFKAWMIAQDWRGNQLDKDLLVNGNKVYGPDTCVFISAQLNTFTVDNGASKGEWPLGVCFSRCHGLFKAQCRDPFTGKKEFLGYFLCAESAHAAWKYRKHQHALRFADLQKDNRLADALRVRYL